MDNPTSKYHIQCKKCGSLNDLGGSFCTECGFVLSPSLTYISYANGSKIKIADWNNRFLAFIIVVVLIGLVIESILFFNDPYGLIVGGRLWLLSLGPFSLLLFLYTAVMEYFYGQTIGRFLLKLKLVSETTGHRPPLRDVIISAGGRAFFVPVDLLLGVVLHGDRQGLDLKQRFTQRLAHTLTIHH
ncbi:MAG: RDD family protein [Promethearchaeota archaeon]